MTDLKLKPCPFCGKHDTLRIASAAEIYDDPDEHDDSYYVAVFCDAARPKGKRGCGGSGGFQATEEGAAAAWNKRWDGETK